MAQTRCIQLQARRNDADRCVPALTLARGAAAAEPEAADRRRLLLRQLAADVERVSGIAVTAMLEAKLARVLASVALPELASWTGRLRALPGDDPEWLSLIETLTVHETFFHRDGSQLDLLRHILREAIAGAASAGRYRLRLWSAGCATGEEAYTLAILSLRALVETGFADEMRDGGVACRAPWQVDVLGTDISRLALAQASAAVYSTEGLSPFRDLPPTLRRFFPAAAGRSAAARSVHSSVIRHVRFRQFNLIAAAPPDIGFDIVLCRNVLIYLTEPARHTAQSVLRQALRPGGYLLLGPTDFLAEPSAYTARWDSGSVAYRLKQQR
jgi:chemotaxis protein methyltransferase CheR